MKRYFIDIIILFYLLSILILGLLLQPINTLISGFHNLFTSSGVIINDFILIGLGPVLVNSGLIGIIGYVVVKINRVSINGPIIAAIITMSAYGFFLVNVYSIFPILLGVYIFSKIRRVSFKMVILPALFGTVLGSLVPHFAYIFNWGIWLGLLFVLLLSILITPFSLSIRKAHKGFLLHDIGFACGFIGLFSITMIRGLGYEAISPTQWGNSNILLIYLFVLIFISLIILGIIINQGKFTKYIEIINKPGTLLTDYIKVSGYGNTIFNMGLVGIICMLYVLLVGGSINGPTIGVILMNVGFAAFGKNPKNIIPILLGVYIGSSLTSVGVNTPEIILAALFATMLAPFAGEYGIIFGVFAGFIYLTVFMNIGFLDNTNNIYNYSFAGGVVGIMFTALLNCFNYKGIFKKRKKIAV